MWAGPVALNCLGSHQQAQCTSCHSSPGFTVPFNASDANDCVGCHRSDFDGEHAGTGFPTTCLDCHTVDEWSGATFDHQQISGFPLLGRHDVLECSSCHTQPGNTLVFATTDADDCVGCHQSDYDGEHSGSGFPTTCTSCHTTDGWGTGTFDHVAISGGFDLIGQHASASCSSCHSLPGNGLPWSPSDQNDCVACHLSEYDQEHAGSNIPTACASCHTTDEWTGAVLDHPTVSNGFDLVGAHSTAPCASCHSNADGSVPWAPANQDDCVACHLPDYNQEHAGTGFPTTCVSCHTENQWTGATFDHPTWASGFDLIGAHFGGPVRQLSFQRGWVRALGTGQPGRLRRVSPARFQPGTRRNRISDHMSVLSYADPVDGRHVQPRRRVLPHRLRQAQRRVGQRLRDVSHRPEQLPGVHLLELPRTPKVGGGQRAQ